MVNKVNRDAFNRFKKLKPKNRMRVANTPVGQSMLSLLTPSQFADLFPKQYRSGYLPDVGGFNLAISKKSQQKQQDYFDSIDQRLGTTSPGAAERTTREGATKRTPGAGATPSGVTPSAGTGNYGSPIKGYWTPERQKYAVDYLIKNGKFTQYGAAAAVARMTREAPGGPGDSNNLGGGHWGVAQWSRSRAGSLWGNTNLDDQLAHYVKESWTTEKKAGDLFRSAKSAREGSEAAMHFERAEGYKESGGKTDVLVDKTPVDTVYGNVFGGGGPGKTPTTGGAPTTGGGYQVSPTGHIQPTDTSLYDSKNAQQCATLSKAFNKDIGRASGWKVERNDAAIKPGVVVASSMYNQGPGKEGSGYHTGVALTAPDKNGNFYMLDQFNPNSRSNGQPAIRQYNVNAYKMEGNYFGIINGRTESSVAALKFAKTLAGKDHPALAQIDGQISYLENLQTSDKKTEVNKEIAKPEPTQIKPVIASSPVPPPPEAKQVLEETATVKKPTGPTPGSFNVNKEAFLSKVKELDGRAYFASEGMIREGFNDDPRVKKAGVYIDENWKLHSKDTSNPDFKDAVKDFGGGILKPIERRSEAETGKQTASLMDRVKKEFGGTAQAQEAGDAFAREAEYRKLHVYGPEMPTEKAGVDPVKMRQKIEAYYGQKIGDHEYDMLIRATHGESSARKHNPQEQAMIMGTILNRAKSHKGGIEGALMARSQFESVTGRTRGKFSPNPAYKAGPSERRMQSMFDAAMNHLHNVPSNQKYFTSEYGDKSGWHKKMVAMGGDVHAGTRFGTKLGQGPAPDVAAVPEAPAPSAMPVQPVQDASIGQRIAREISPVTPAQAATPAPAPAPKPAEPPEFPKATTQGVPTPPTRPTAFVAPPEPVKPPDESSTQNFLRTQGIPAQPVPGASDGGAFDLAISPLDKRDDHAVINTKTQQPLFTVKSGERINVTPQQKVDGNMGPSGPDYGKEMDALRHELSSSMASAGDPPKVQMRQVQQQKSDDPNFGERLLKANKNKPYSNPAFERAMNRTRMQETGDTLNGHFSAGNTNY